MDGKIQFTNVCASRNAKKAQINSFKMIQIFTEMGDNARLVVAQLVSEKREILFNALSPVLTRRDKEQAWEAIRQTALAGGCNTLADKDWKYMRDGVWGPSRRDALKKYDIAQRSGEGAVRFSQIDRLVLDIVGRESSVVKGLGVKDTEEDIRVLNEPENKEDVNEKLECQLVSDSPSGASKEWSGKTGLRSVFATNRSPRQYNYRSPSVKRSPSTDSEELDFEIKRNKLLLVQEQLRGQQLANQKMELEIKEIRSRQSSGSSSLACYASTSLTLGTETDQHRSRFFEPIFRSSQEQDPFENERQFEDDQLGQL